MGKHREDQEGRHRQGDRRQGQGRRGQGDPGAPRGASGSSSRASTASRSTPRSSSGGRAGTTGGIITTEAPIHVSNVMLVEGDGVTRVGFRRDVVQKRRPDGSTYAGTRSVRVSRKTGKEI